MVLTIREVSMMIKETLTTGGRAKTALSFLQKQKWLLISSSYIVVDSLTINGELTQGENIADIGGVMMDMKRLKNQTIPG